MREIIFKTETKSYRWRPTRWQKAVKFGLQVVFVGVIAYAAMFTAGLLEMGA